MNNDFQDIKIKEEYTDFNQEFYACWSKDEKSKKQSSSGGMFTELATQTLNKNGVVYGVAWRNSTSAEYVRCTDLETLDKLKQSKYIQSRSMDIFKNVKIDLDNGIDVLFVGVSCQVAALKTYLKKEYNNLLSADLICHGVPSELVLEKYIKHLENKHNKKIANIHFRHKVTDWENHVVRVVFDDETEECIDNKKDAYFIAFVKNLSLRECCYNCKYTNLNRVSDLTLADFWGYFPTVRKMKNYKQGCSLCITNTEKGLLQLNNLSDKIVIEKSTKDLAQKSNSSLTKPYDKHKDYNEFWKDIEGNVDFETITEKYLQPIVRPTPNMVGKLKSTIKFDYYYMIPKFIRKKL